MRLKAWTMVILFGFAAGCGDDDDTTANDGPPNDTMQQNDGGAADGAPDAPVMGQLCDGVTPVAGMPTLTTQLVVNINNPIDIESPRDDVHRLFVATMDGTIRIIDLDTDTEVGTFLDITGDVGFDGGEAGLLGLAFHPQYSTNGRFFLYYSDNGGQNVIYEYHVTADPNVADPNGTQIFAMPTEQSNHNGGGMEFGPDGLLYVGSGDGGNQGDPDGDARDLNDPLGKVLRFDVDIPDPYIPAGNPFVAGGGNPAVFNFGYRNPWRLSIDRMTGDLYVGDVGQNTYEEVSVAPGPDRGNGADFGWNNCEGLHAYNGGTCPGAIDPVAEFDHGQGNAVIGGYVYYGCLMPGWHGTYFYGDNGAGFVRSFVYAGGAATNQMDQPNLDQGQDSISTFGLDARGELYIGNIGDGTVSRVVPQ